MTYGLLFLAAILAFLRPDLILPILYGVGILGVVLPVLMSVISVGIFIAIRHYTGRTAALTLSMTGLTTMLFSAVGLVVLWLHAPLGAVA